MTDLRFERYAPLTDLSIRSDGDGRTVEALAAVFNTPQEIHDRDGHYNETIDRAAFDLSINQRGAGGFQYMFNHGKTMYGTPSEKWTTPIGVPLEVRPDAAGLVTRSRISATPNGDEILQLVKDGAIKGYSFSGGFRSTNKTPARMGALPVFHRTEIALREFGPTPFPYYEAARITGVRAEAQEMFATMSTAEILAVLSPLPDSARAELVAALQSVHTDTGDDGTHGHTDTGDADPTPTSSHRDAQRAALDHLLKETTHAYA